MGKMDAVAFRPEESEVLIVDWKTSTQKGTESLDTWWDKAGNFGDALYQTLVYRELLTKHLKRSTEVDIKVGVMLVPYHQSNEELLVPGSCVDFSEIEKAGLLSGLKQYRWVCHESELVHTINFPGCKMFKKLEELNELQCVDEETDLLKEGISLKDVISDDAKIADLREEMGLLSLKVTRNVGEVEKTGGKERRGRGRVRGEVTGGPQGGGGERGRARGEVRGTHKEEEEENEGGQEEKLQEDHKEEEEENEGGQEEKLEEDHKEEKEEEEEEENEEGQEEKLQEDHKEEEEEENEEGQEEKLEEDHKEEEEEEEEENEEG